MWKIVLAILVATVSVPAGAGSPPTGTGHDTAASPTAPPPPAAAEAPLSNDDVVALSRAKLSDAIITSKIQQAHDEKLDVSTEAILDLQKKGVSQGVIEVMVKRVAADAAPPPTPAATPSLPAAAPAAEPGSTPESGTSGTPRWKFWRRGASAPEKNDSDSASGAPRDVHLFLTQRPSEPFHELGRVSAGKYNFAGITRDRAAVDAEIKKKAAALGADAVIDITEDFAGVSGVAVAFDEKPPGTEGESEYR